MDKVQKRSDSESKMKLMSALCGRESAQPTLLIQLPMSAGGSTCWMMFSKCLDLLAQLSDSPTDVSRSRVIDHLFTVWFYSKYKQQNKTSISWMYQLEHFCMRYCAKQRLMPVIMLISQSMSQWREITVYRLTHVRSRTTSILQLGYLIINILPNGMRPENRPISLG
jgi:hypothetical protein